jgi:serine/threonine protein kinase
MNLQLESIKLKANRYVPTRLIGQGGMGTVYEATDSQSGERVALKIMKESLWGSASAGERFNREATLMKLSHLHAGLVNVREFGNEANEEASPYIVMDFVEGRSLSYKLNREGKLSLSELKPIFDGLVDVLSFIHSQGIIHRDLKPSNILIERESNTVKIVDFGIAGIDGAAAGVSQKLTSTGDFFGSPLYMSPEQCRGEKTDRRSDIYSLGCLLFECLTGAPPYNSKNGIKVLVDHLEAPVPEISAGMLKDEVPENLLEDLNYFFSKLLAKDIESRYQSIDEVKSDFANLGKDKQEKPELPPVPLNQRVKASTIDALIKATLLAPILYLTVFASGEFVHDYFAFHFYQTNLGHLLSVPATFLLFLFGIIYLDSCVFFTLPLLVVLLAFSMIDLDEVMRFQNFLTLNQGKLASSVYVHFSSELALLLSCVLVSLGNFIYDLIFLRSKLRATPGMLVSNLKLVEENFERKRLQEDDYLENKKISFYTVLLRYATAAIGLLDLFIPSRKGICSQDYLSNSKLIASERVTESKLSLPASIAFYLLSPYLIVLFLHFLVSENLFQFTSFAQRGGFMGLTASEMMKPFCITLPVYFVLWHLLGCKLLVNSPRPKSFTWYMLFALPVILCGLYSFSIENSEKSTLRHFERRIESDLGYVLPPRQKLRIQSKLRQNP